MAGAHEELRVGLDALDAVTALLQRVRNADPTAGLFEVAEIQWWWTSERSTDSFGQLVWFDDDGQPVAAVLATDFSGGDSPVLQVCTLVVVTMPGASPDWIAHVVERGLAHVTGAGFTSLDIEIERGDELRRELFTGHGFAVVDDALIGCWLDAAARPAVSTLADGYRSCSRLDTAGTQHHLATPRRPAVEERLRQTSLYRPDLDLVVLDAGGEPAAYALFWYDPVTAVGVVEPVRTHDAHQRRGLSRHVLTKGTDLLAQAGAERVSIAFEPENTASSTLYLSLGFVPDWRTDLYARA